MKFLAPLLFAPPILAAITLDVTSQKSLEQASSTAAYDMMAYYTGNQTGQIPGKLEGTWWEGGAMFMGLIQYWYMTGDSSYNPTIQQGMYFQKGHNDFFPDNQSSWLVRDLSLPVYPFSL
jgi:mannan endo-1,6-alpha-mannosidase